MTAHEKRDRFAFSRPVEGSAGRTGSWRVFFPVVDQERCNRCGLCALYCPDAVIDHNLIIDLVYCKGCGICAHECPKKAVAMIREEK
ncbi:4Fe-4S binding protein [Methanoregula sp.]|uniref:4Fe-4S binding protein n=1 Tax=Methanoregula sp. TaxID=2052170 RepID=UPI00356A94E9